jgi:hypothetical protein
MLQVTFTGTSMREINAQIREYISEPQSPVVQAGTKLLKEIDSKVVEAISKATTPVSLLDVRTRFVEALKKDMQKAVAILAQFKVSKVSDLEPKQYNDFCKAIGEI